MSFPYGFPGQTGAKAPCRGFRLPTFRSFQLLPNVATNQPWICLLTDGSTTSTNRKTNPKNIRSAAQATGARSSRASSGRRRFGPRIEMLGISCGEASDCWLSQLSHRQKDEFGQNWDHLGEE